MKRYSIIFATSLAIFTTCFFSSCKEKAPIEREKMTQIIADYYILEAAAKHEMREIKTTDMNLYYADLLKHYEVTAAEFDSSISFYSARPIEFKEIYEDAIKIVNKKLDDLNKELAQ